MRPFRVIRRILSRRNKESSQYCPLSLPASHTSNIGTTGSQRQVRQIIGQKRPAPRPIGWISTVSEPTPPRHATRPPAKACFQMGVLGELRVVCLVHVPRSCVKLQKKNDGYRTWSALHCTPWCWSRCHLPRFVTPAKIAARGMPPASLVQLKQG